MVEPFGGEPNDGTAIYDQSLESGSSVIIVAGGEDEGDRIVAILEIHKPIEIDERTASFGLAHPTGTARREREATLPLSEESLRVGKRLVNRGDARIRRYVVETPVVELVSLHTEKVMLGPHAVTDDRPAVGEMFTYQTVEMTGSAEEAVVSKTARVVEEVRLRKEATDRVETIRDSVRKEKVEVRQLPGTDTDDTGRTRTPKS